MATVSEILTQIDQKTDNMAKEIGEARVDLVEIKNLIATLKAGQTDPNLIAQAQGILDKVSKVDADLASTESDLASTGKGGTV